MNVKTKRPYNYCGVMRAVQKKRKKQLMKCG